MRKTNSVSVSMSEDILKYYQGLKKEKEEDEQYAKKQKLKYNPIIDEKVYMHLNKNRN